MSLITKTAYHHFGPRYIELENANKYDEYMLIDYRALKKIIRFIHTETDLAVDYLSDICAIDYPGREKRFDVNYVLYSMKNNIWVRIKTMVAEGDQILSLTDIWEGAYYPETEIYDMFGIVFRGNDFQRRLFMPEDYQGHPLRKDFESPWEDITFK